MSQKALPSGGGEAGSEATSLCKDEKSSLCAAMQLLSRGLSESPGAGSTCHPWPFYR